MTKIKNNERWLSAGSRAEEAFVTLFAQLFGPEKAQQLLPQHEFIDMHGKNRFIDFALETVGGRFAFEIDGVQWHHPAATDLAGYEEHLGRQNSLVHNGWLVLRWTDRQVVWLPETVKDELAFFLEKVPRFLGNDDFLPCRPGALVPLKHQETALEDLQRLRDNGKSIALLDHPTGSGKTLTAIMDAKSMGGQTLYIAHTDNLVRQTAKEIRKHWPEVSCGLYLGHNEDFNADNLAASVQKLSRNIGQFSPEQFDYVIVDEAHRATAPSYQLVLSHFNPRFVLGLTATPERADGQHVLELFQNATHRLSLEQAVKQGHLVPIRCIRIKTNVDLSKVRYNAANYYSKDLENAIRVPSRDQLIVDTYKQYVSGRPAVCFAVNVAHGETLAKVFRQNGVESLSVSGQVSPEEREEIFSKFRDGSIQVICACDVLNEGWDCPEVEVLLMARPTLSKVLYMQQLGRGTRKSSGKKDLVVFDFVDNVHRYCMPQSVHRILSKSQYRPGALVVAPDDLMADEKVMIEKGDVPFKTLDVALWTRGLEEIDVFSWQEIRQHMWSASELEVELGAGNRRVTNAAKRGDIIADHEVPVGENTIYFFDKSRLNEIRETIGLRPINRETIKELFLDFVEEMDMSSSYKPVFLKSVLAILQNSKRVSVKKLVHKFREFYISRASEGLIVESPRNRLSKIQEMSEDEIASVMLSMPFEKFERRKFMQYDKDLAYITLNRYLWKQLTPKECQHIRECCEDAIGEYYERLQ